MSADGQASIRLRRAVREAMLAHARDAAPNECCGLLAGRGDEVDEAIPAANVSERPRVRFELDPAAHIAALRGLRGTGRSILGCYHSHPAGPATPSETDIAMALYSDFVWVIVSMAESGQQVNAFRIDGAGVHAVALHLAEEEDR